MHWWGLPFFLFLWPFAGGFVVSSPKRPRRNKDSMLALAGYKLDKKLLREYVSVFPSAAESFSTPLWVSIAFNVALFLFFARFFLSAFLCCFSCNCISCRFLGRLVVDAASAVVLFRSPAGWSDCLWDKFEVWDFCLAFPCGFCVCGG